MEIFLSSKYPYVSIRETKITLLLHILCIFMCIYAKMPSHTCMTLLALLHNRVRAALFIQKKNVNVRNV